MTDQPVTSEALKESLAHLTNAIAILQFTPVPKKGIIIDKTKVPKADVIRAANQSIQFLVSMAQQIKSELQTKEDTPAVEETEVQA